MRVIIFALSLACAGTALAQQGKGSGNAAFDNLDRNADGFLSRGELAGERELGKRFARFDVDKDGRQNVSDFMKANQDKDGCILTDTAITAKVKASLLAQRGIPSAAISVETYESRVLLSGFVDSEAVKTKAGKLDAGVSGVKQV
ncbi:MAG: BON domain-containing protein [Proteobacteria bacterium]|nr:BON domain-containing protein [Pseudomonadota bacterium]